MNEMNKINYAEALEYHEKDKPGKIAITATKSLVTQQDLSLAYSPGVAAPCLEISKNLDAVYKYTSRSNLVAVISNGTAVLGLGNLGAAASKPVMEGKAVLFKKFADIDAIDLEINTEDPIEFINAVKYLSYSFGGINLEDIKAPECFLIEEKLKSLMDIPVFHDDQHGTAIITAAGLINAAYLTNRTLEDLKIVINGAGAAAIACIDLLIALGVDKSKIILCDTKGVIYKGRTSGMNKWKERYASDTKIRTLTESLNNADVFIGLSVKGAVTKDMISQMAHKPIIFAMANPDPEITPEDIKFVRDDAIIATGRSDYNNQINNVMGFPYIFRGALDVRASTINTEMKIAAARAIADLARRPVPEEVYKAYSGRKLVFGNEYIIPVPFDPRLITVVAAAVAVAAIETGVARVKDFSIGKYKQQLGSRLNPTANYMNFLAEKIHNVPLKRIVFAEGEEEEVISAALMMRDEKYGNPIIIGRVERIEVILKKIGKDISLDGIQIMNAALSDRLEQYTDYLYKRLQRKGYLYRDCAKLVKTDKNIFAACMVACGDGDALLTGVTKSYIDSLEDIMKVISPKQNRRILGYSIMIAKDHNIIIADNCITEYPNSLELAQIATQTAEIAKNMGITPRVALISFATFGNSSQEKTTRIREAVNILDNFSKDKKQLNDMKVDFEYDGEMSIKVALDHDLRKLYNFCRLSGSANVLIMPGLNSAAIATELLQKFSSNSFIGPITNGFEKPVQILQTTATANEILKIATFACVEAIKEV
ncbi:NADP-dependent malic enzyme [Rickettsia typhi]|uniref:Malic enzyme n=2 Tax=Rickettsia typhi TaxID=785 RepID=Q68X02_RICTY|nr:NADP-dependent malic enzyme [Rickettsia typhi]AAU03840.1 Malic enzyme [Rickettsia typhi str. Wilmington]AFE54218.1 bifunctional malic enzyme oxidoreductase/phosphotransacetylase [Rickettsia typhi str. TH1527]AFE55058.1 bifunctional malic enzyme oxidoreductase/phosphotransacetylase [Rickettsia typhi str. B9991CWPP]